MRIGTRLCAVNTFVDKILLILIVTGCAGELKGNAELLLYLGVTVIDRVVYRLARLIFYEEFGVLNVAPIKELDNLSVKSGTFGNRIVVKS